MKNATATAAGTVLLLAFCACASASYSPVNQDLTNLSLMQAAIAARSEATTREAAYMRASPPGYKGQIFSCSPQREVFSTARMREIKSCD